MRLSWILAAGLAWATVIDGLPAAQKRDVWSTLRTNIKHVIYLMMENHSFDNIAGYWNFNPNIDNLVNINYCNNYTNPNWTVWGEPLSICASPYEQEVPLTDPDHNFAGSDKYNATPGDSSFVIKAYDPKKTAILTTIAQNFAFWDSYHAEHPGPTDPNRQFATSGSSCGYVDNTNQAAGFFMNSTGTNCTKSIFEVLDEANISWKNYYETDIIDAYIYQYVQTNAMSKLVHSNQFYSDLANGKLPTFSYINPECCTIDSMHPTSNMVVGEQMIKHLYDAVRASQYWDNVLIVINFDEHGGFADHVPPPANVPAPQDGIKFSGLSDGHNVTYDFTRLGVRVPAFLISPWIPANTLIHDEGTMYADNSAYTHSSILHFLQQLWQLPPMNNRVAWAKTFEYVFGNTKRDDTPAKLPIPIWYGGHGAVQPKPFYLLNQDASYYENGT